MLQRLRFICLALCSTLVACGYPQDYEIVEQSEQDHVAWAKVNLFYKPDKEEFRTIAEDVCDDLDAENGYTLFFAIPSEYPDYPENPWAKYERYGDDKLLDATIYYYGTQTDEQEKLKAMAPVQSASVAGRWYVYEPTRERSLYILTRDSGFILIQNEFYSEWPEGESDFSYRIETSEIALIRKSSALYTSITGDTTYAIDSAGDMSLNESYSVIARKY